MNFQKILEVLNGQVILRQHGIWLKMCNFRSFLKKIDRGNPIENVWFLAFLKKIDKSNHMKRRDFFKENR